MNSSTRLTVFPIMLVLAILLAILSIATAFCRTEKIRITKTKQTSAKRIT